MCQYTLSGKIDLLVLDGLYKILWTVFGAVFFTCTFGCIMQAQLHQVQKNSWGNVDSHGFHTFTIRNNTRRLAQLHFYDRRYFLNTLTST